VIACVENKALLPVHLMVKMLVPLVPLAGVPDITPVLELSDNPDGRLPEEMDQA